MTDRAGLAAVLEYARAQQHDDPQRSLALFENVAERAATAGELLLAADAWLGCGESAGLIDGRERESLIYLRRAAELAPGTTVAALSWMSAGDMLRFCGEPDDAAEAYFRAVTLFAGLSDAFGECLARQALAALLVSGGRAEEALPHFVCASSLALDTDEPEMAAGLQLALGQELSGLKRRSEAISPLTAAAELSRMIGNGQLEARARGALLNALHSAQPGFGPVHREQLVRLAELAAANATPEGSTEDEGAARFMLPALRGVPAEAASDLTGNAIAEARARLELAMQLVALGRGGAGFSQFRSSSELYEAAGQAQGAARALLGCAGALLTEGLAQESAGWFSRAAGRFEACGDETGVAQAQAGRLQALADLQQWDEIDTSRKVLAITEQDQAPQARAARLIALTYQVQALIAGQDHAGAARAAIQAADLASELEERELEARLRLGAGHSLRLLKRFPEAADAYEKAITVIAGLADASDWEAQALEGIGAVLQDSPKTGAERLRQRAEQYVAVGDQRMEALCRHQLALLLERIRPAQHAECGAEFARAAQLFDQVGDTGRAGDCWYRAAQAYNWLGLLYPEYREMCYDACGVAADRFGSSGNTAGKGFAEFMAGQALRKDDPAAAQDPRNLPALRRSARSFARAGLGVPETASRVMVTTELAWRGREDAWIASGLLTLRSFEAARARLLIPQHRQRDDKQIIRGLQILGTCLWRAWDSKGGTRRWTELAWRLEQATKGRSFLDQHHQDEVWNSLVASDDILRELTSKIEHLALRRDELTRVIDAALVARQLGGKIQEKADLRNAVSSDLEQTQRQLDRRVAEVTRARPDQAGLASVPPVTREELQECLSPGEAYLGYSWNGGSVIRSLVTPSMVRIQAVGHGFGDYVRRAVAAARDGEAPPDDNADAVAGLLGELPAGTGTLIISPDGLLNGFPWHLIPLPGSGDLLGDRYSTAIVPAAGILPRLRACRGGAAERAGMYLGVACDGAATGARLACVDGEVEAIARSYFAADPGSGFLTTADCHQLLEQGCRVHLLHLACHADRNGLLLSRDGTWVTPVDLVGRGLRAGILLLTGCSAGDFSGQDNNEFLGVVRQLIIATGSRAAIVSVAPVPDNAAPVFADLVLSALTGRNPGRRWSVPAHPLAVGQAVAWARQALRERSRTDVAPLIPGPDAFPRPWDPKWWTPWFVVGDPNALLGS
jgi:tetratricopeptide (TPR) repeat protein